MLEILKIAISAGLKGPEIVEKIRKYLGEAETAALLLDLEKRARSRARLILAERHIDALMHFYGKGDDVGLRTYAVETAAGKWRTTLVAPVEWLRIDKKFDPKHGYVSILGAAMPLVDEERIAKLTVEWKVSEIEVWDAPLYTLRKVEIGETVAASFGLTRFLSYAYSYRYLEDELFQVLAASSGDPATAAEGLTVRERLLPSARSVLNFSQRLCAGGIATVVAFRATDSKGWNIVVQRRSNKVIEGRGYLSALPEGFHQPTIDGALEANLSMTVYREIFEELFGGEESTAKHRRLDPSWYIKANPTMRALDGALRAGSAEMRCTGFAFDLMTGAYIAAVLVIVDDPSFWDKHSGEMRTNWEVAEAGEQGENVRPLLETADPAALRQLLERRDWGPQGRFAFARGLATLSSRRPGTVSLPDGFIELGEDLAPQAR